MPRHRILFAALCLLMCRVAGAAGLQWYEAGDWAALRAQHASAPWVVHFWGMSCAPCHEEMPAWRAFIHKHPQARLTFIEVERSEPSAVQAALAKGGLTDTDQRLSAEGFDAAERYAIDRHWGGETPMTLLIAPDGQTRKIMGPMNFDRLAAWVAGKTP